MKKILVTTFFAVGVVVATAELPFIFEADTPAVADHVNQNFSYLKDQISGLQQRTSTIEDNPENLGIRFEDISDIYSPVASNIGETITINEQVYRIVSFPITSIEGDEKYHLKLPIRQRQNSEEIYIGVNYKSKHNVSTRSFGYLVHKMTINNKELIFNNTFDGGPISTRISIKYTVNPDGTQETNYSLSDYGGYISLILPLKNSYARIDIDVPVQAVDETFTVNSENPSYDFTNHMIDFEPKDITERVKEALDEFVDYIEIESIE